MILGKLIAGLIGLISGGFVGLLIGLFVGHLFDRGLASVFRLAAPEVIARIQASFFETTFHLLGHLAKSDGRISQQEIDHTESIITQMGLDTQQRARAIELFKEGAASDFSVESALSSFNEVCRGQKQLQQTMLLFLTSLALADDHQIEQSELAALERIASLMSFSRDQLDQLLQMLQAQEQFHGYGSASGSVSPAASLQAAYAALGVSEGVSDKDLKRAYRKLMSQNHPDKLIARGVPEHMIKLATEKSQEIQNAYELIRKRRGSSR